MTHDVPGNEERARRWCENCRIAVEPVDGDHGPECPSCGREF
jgi:Zn finger protein HypA/HybF involved in hydrogenase expression